MEGNLYMTVHSGSRHLGKEVAEFYLKEGQKQLKDRGIEVPFAYRGIAQIQDSLSDTVDIVERFLPIYNFKAGDGGKK